MRTLLVITVLAIVLGASRVDAIVPVHLVDAHLAFDLETTSVSFLPEATVPIDDAGAGDCLRFIAGPAVIGLGLTAALTLVLIGTLSEAFGHRDEATATYVLAGIAAVGGIVLGSYLIAADLRDSEPRVALADRPRQAPRPERPAASLAFAW